MRRPPRRSRLRIEITTLYTAEIRGVGAGRVLERLHVPRQYMYRPPSGGSPCWTVPARHARDVEAMTESLGGSVVIDGQQVLA